MQQADQPVAQNVDFPVLALIEIADAQERIDQAMRRPARKLGRPHDLGKDQPVGAGGDGVEHRRIAAKHALISAQRSLQEQTPETGPRLTSPP